MEELPPQLLLGAAGPHAAPRIARARRQFQQHPELGLPRWKTVKPPLGLAGAAGVCRNMPLLCHLAPGAAAQVRAPPLRERLAEAAQGRQQRLLLLALRLAAEAQPQSPKAAETTQKAAGGGRQRWRVAPLSCKSLA